MERETGTHSMTEAFRDVHLHNNHSIDPIFQCDYFDDETFSDITIVLENSQGAAGRRLSLHRIVLAAHRWPAPACTPLHEPPQSHP